MESLNKVLDKREQGEKVSSALVALIVVLFVLVLLVSVVIGCCSIVGKAPRMTYCWVIFMWIMLMIGFLLVAGKRGRAQYLVATEAQILWIV